MRGVNLIRCKKPDRTIGMLVINGYTFHTEELAWKDNKPSISCIPDGIYPYRRDMSVNKDRSVIELRNVPNRSQIQIHAIGRLEGCIGLLADGVGEDAIEVERLVHMLMGECGHINIQTIGE